MATKMQQSTEETFNDEEFRFLFTQITILENEEFPDNKVKNWCPDVTWKKI